MRGYGDGWGKIKNKLLGHQSFPQRLNRRLWAELGATRNKPKTRQAGRGKSHHCLVPLSDTGNAESERSLMESANLPFGMLSKTVSPHEEQPCLLSPSANPQRCWVTTLSAEGTHDVQTLCLPRSRSPAQHNSDSLC